MLLNQASRIDSLNSVDEVWDHVQRSLSAHRLEFLIYLTVDTAWQNPVLMTNIPELYQDQDVTQDPFLSHCCYSYEITLTGPDYLPDYDYLPDDAKAFITKARKTGFSSGMGIPMRLQGSQRFGGFNLGTRLGRDAFEAELVPRREEIRAFCLLAHRRIEELAEGGGTLHKFIAPGHAGLDLLSPREREVAFLVAQGFSRKECARLCALSPNTVSDYMKSVYKKLGINDRISLSHYVLAAGAPPTPPQLPG